MEENLSGFARGDDLLTVEELDAKAKSRRDFWLSVLLPVFVPILVMLCFREMTATSQDAKQTATLAAVVERVSQIDIHLSATDTNVSALEKRLPLDYVPRAEHVRNVESEKEMRDETRQELKELASKVDLVLENQARNYARH